jgi:hypothetical protein
VGFDAGKKGAIADLLAIAPFLIVHSVEFAFGVNS